jgi:hypothetical protein
MIKDNDMGGYVAYMEETSNVYKIFVGKPDRRKTRRRPRHKEAVAS